MNNVWTGWGPRNHEPARSQHCNNLRSNAEHAARLPNVHMTKCNAAAEPLALNDYRHQASVMLRILAPVRSESRLHQFFHLSRIACSPSSASAYQCQPQLLWCPARQGAGINGGWPGRHPSKSSKVQHIQLSCSYFGPGSGRTWRLPTTCAGDKDHRRRMASNSFKFHWAMRYAFITLQSWPIWGPSLDKSSYFPGLQSHSSCCLARPKASWTHPLQLNNCGTSQHEALTIFVSELQLLHLGVLCDEDWHNKRCVENLGRQTGHWPLNGNVDPIEIHHSSILLAPCQVRAPESSISTIVLNLHDVKMQMSASLYSFSAIWDFSRISAPTLISAGPSAMKSPSAATFAAPLLWGHDAVS